jgi:hypothetical protein
MTKRGERRGRREVAAALVAAVAVILLLTGCESKSTDANVPPGMTYASIERLPDFSGWWYLDLDPKAGFGGTIPLLLGSLQPVLRPELQQQYEQIKGFLTTVEKNAGALPDPVDFGAKPDYCVPPIFSGFNGGFEDNVEFLFTPGRVTITSELGMLRRVYLGHDLPADAEESKMGTSVGHWEGNTLVVETSGLDHAGALVGALKIGKGAHMTERITLKTADTMEIVRELVAPEVLTAPYETTFAYRRDPGHVFHESSHCESDDRSVNQETGRQQFDLTPPSDLPPPPQ